MSKLHGNRIEVGNISTSNRNSLSNVNGHLVYNTDTNLLQYYNPAGWQSLGDASPNTKSDYPTPSGSTVGFTDRGNLLLPNSTSTICPYAASVFVFVTFTKIRDFSASVNCTSLP